MILSPGFAKVMSMDRLRKESESSTDSDFAGLENLAPLELEDLRPHIAMDQGDSSGNDDIDIGVDGVNKFFSVAMGLKRKMNGFVVQDDNKKPNVRARMNWKRAMALIRTRSDPWEKFHLDELPVEKCIRYRFNALSKKWKEDTVFVKIDINPFNHGAMRECYRMKKQSNSFSDGHNWASDCNNYVAKCYMNPNVDRDTYFEDVKLQMEAKLWGEEYNRHNPPKKVDIFQMSIIEFVERLDKPLFHVEHFIDGQYIKYSSNSGFVDGSLCRQTPHAFSHFTFERSGHEMIVVDIQGVGDLYTDPQIHTWQGDDYGDGNLGTKGMALFFHTHSCNNICKRLNLTAFDLAVSEKEEISSKTSCNSTATILRGNEIILESPVGSEPSEFPKFFRHGIDHPRRHRTFSDYFSAEDGSPPNSIIEDVASIHFSSHESLIGDVVASAKRRTRYISECSDDSGIRTRDMDNFQDLLKGKARPACVLDNDCNGDSILGEIHLDLAKYHEVCRFVEDGASDYDHATALFHLRVSADCGILCSIMAYARLHFDLPHDILTDVWPDGKLTNEEKCQIGMKYMLKAAMRRDRSCMVFTAQAYDHGYFDVEQNLNTAVYWYTLITEDDQNGEVEESWAVDDPPYLILSRLAEIWKNGFDATPPSPRKSGDLYNRAAESAMSCMKGKLANQYYMLAEEVWGEVEE